MVFSSYLFICIFLPFCVLGYFGCPVKYRNNFLLLTSGLFYFWGSPDYFIVLCVTLSADYWLIKMAKNQKVIWPYYLSISSSIIMLIYYKYAGFFLSNLNQIVPIPNSLLHDVSSVVLPIGVSFVTFQKISYALDVKHRSTPPANKFTHYLLYILFFPQLIAGPIVRYKDIAYQLVRRNKKWSDTNVFHGLIQFILGLSKKVLIANTLAQEIKLIDLSSASFDGAIIWAITFAMQLYFDFSGYSDMAIGVARIFGFKIPENFKWPYISTSITEFWKRWHITLGKWMMDYLYIPLGGNKGSKFQTYRNLSFVFLFSGLWHGASWNFIIWGAFHGCFLIVERMFLGKLLIRVPPIFARIYVFIIVVYGFAIFNSETTLKLQNFHSALSKFYFSFNYSLNSIKLFTFILISLIGCYSGVYISKSFNRKIIKLQKEKEIYLLSFAIICLFILSLSQLQSANFNPFIYFRF